ncbi:hypothetical protein G6F24_016956 [Rhizopus arrhizus]|nr:hypothetical protein G6F24_016956 [Rhizopus arrhizus]
MQRRGTALPAFDPGLPAAIGAYLVFETRGQVGLHRIAERACTGHEGQLVHHVAVEQHHRRPVRSIVPAQVPAPVALAWRGHQRAQRDGPAAVAVHGAHQPTSSHTPRRARR